MTISEIWDRKTLTEKRNIISQTTFHKYIMKNEDYIDKQMQEQYNNLSSYLKNEIRNIIGEI